MTVESNLGPPKLSSIDQKFPESDSQDSFKVPNDSEKVLRSSSDKKVFGL